MMSQFKNYLIVVCLLLTSFSSLANNQFQDSLKLKLAGEVSRYLKPLAAINVKIKVESIVEKRDDVAITFGNIMSDYYFRDSTISKIYSIAQSYFPGKRLSLYANGSSIEELASKFYSGEEYGMKKEKIKKRAKIKLNANETYPLVKNLSVPYSIPHGLQNKYIAMWQSHGFYYDQPLQRWEWQRARIFRTVEDIYTQSYVVPFLVPMLENAGANVLLPRERDCQRNEVIVDNDSGAGIYSEVTGSNSWATGEVGFSNPKSAYGDGENPFIMGTYRYADVVTLRSIDKGSKKSVASWRPKVPETGEYAVYVSYKTLPNSTPAARYTVKYSGGEKSFNVNQQMGGGTWIYLGKFMFDKDNSEQGLYLSNLLSEPKLRNKGYVITADAAKFGGGMGNIARHPSDNMVENIKSSSSDSLVELKNRYYVEPQTSGYPRYTEGARYWLQWAGFADSVYTYSKMKNDYNDDYMSRGRWVNALLGGSSKNPGAPGYNIPVDLSFAFHTDAGTFLDDSIVGTLSIYTKTSNDSDRYLNGESRMWGRELADIVQTQLVNDVRSGFEPNWSRRGLWDRSYAESRTPEVPAMLLEFLSHQNFADMKYGLDPTFRFAVSRAIYKGILKFLSLKNGSEYIVQPLPVKNFAITFSPKKVKGGSAKYLKLSWQPQADTLEPSAVAKKYIVYKRVGKGGFDNGTVVNETSTEILIEPNIIYGFKVAAINEGGVSFPSEILSAGIASGALSNNKTVMIVNGFERLSAPATFQSKDSTYAGFYDEKDHGVPYINEFSFIGSQYEIRREIPWMDDDSPGFGASYSDYEDKVIAGNTFDYPSLHGKAFMDAGYNFVSSSVASVREKNIQLNEYYIVDFIMGKQTQTKIGRGVKPIKYEVYPSDLRDVITEYCNTGGKIIVSGAYVATDLWDTYKVTPEGKKFAKEVLKFKWMTHYASKDGEVKSVANPYGFSGRFNFYNTPNEKSYVVEAPDAMTPEGPDAYTIFRYSNNISAGVAYSGNYKSVVLGFPIETLTSQEQINEVIAQIIAFFDKR